MSALSRREMLVGGASLASALAVPAFATKVPYQETGPVSNTGRVSGRVLYKGDGVVVPKFPVVKDHDICGHDDRAPKALRVDEENGGTLGDVVVEIKGMTSGRAWSPEFSHGKIYQIDCSFQPYVQIIRSDAYVDVFNFDPIMHNIHAYEVFNDTRRSMFNIAQPQKGQIDRIDLKFRRGNILMIDCNAHNWMAAFVYTSASPYLFVTGTNGVFDIPDVPPGSYELSVWHPMLGTKSARLDVAPGANMNFDLNLH